MRKLLDILYLFLSVVFIQTCDAADVKTQTTPVCYVGNIAKVSAQMAWKVDCFYYSESVADYKQVLANASPKDPDFVLAHFFDYTLGGKADFEGYTKFFDPAEDQVQLKARFNAAKDDAQAIKEITFVARYDVGQFSFISYIVGTGGPNDKMLGVRVLKKTETGWVMTSKDHLETSAGCLSELDSGNRFMKFNGTLAKSYQYTMPLPGWVGDTNTAIHPCALLFNGNRYDLKLGNDAQPVDALASFVNQAWLVSKGVAKDEWLKLFTKEEAALREGDMKDVVVAQSDFFPAKNDKLVFAIDFGPQAVAFLEDIDHPQSPLQPLLLWKGTTTDYKLTDVTANVTDAAPFEQSFPGNFPKMFELKDFQDALRKIVEEKAPSK